MYFIAIGFYIICAIGYYIFLYKKVRFPGFDVATIFLQKLLCVAETDWDGFDFEKKDEDKKWEEICILSNICTASGGRLNEYYYTN